MTGKGLAMSLLRVVQSPPERETFQASAVLRGFVQEHGIGVLDGSRIIFTASHKERIRALLRADNIDPETAPDAWAGRGRSEALSIGPDEKWAGEAVRARRIAFKTLQGRPLVVDGKPLYLPFGSNLEWSVSESVAHLNHESVVVVENWEIFERIDELQVDMAPAGANPLIVWRGGGERSATGAALEFLEAYGRPVWSAPDYDPAGLAIAARLPHLAGVLTPPPTLLQALLAESRLNERYLQQLPGAQATLEASQHPDIQNLWRAVRSAGKALPQEKLRDSLKTCRRN